jgi:hypothetical protein
MTTELVGQRVKVLSYGGRTDDRYVGLTGLVSFSVTRRSGEIYMVLLDEDPSPAMGELFGGLPCYDYELEVIDA